MAIKHYVIAPHYRAYQNWCFDNNIPRCDAFFIDDARQLRGRVPDHDAELYFILDSHRELSPIELSKLDDLHEQAKIMMSRRKAKPNG